MTGVRKSVLLAPEIAFGKGRGTNPWFKIPPNTQFEHTLSTSVQTLYTTGSKKWDDVAYGSWNGTWSMSFVLDYDYMDIFAYFFEGYEHSTVTENGKTKHKHVFKKSQFGRVKTLCACEKQLNRIVDSASKDETLIMLGMAPKSVRFSQSGGTSQISVNISGVYVDEVMGKENLSKNDYQDYNGHLVEFQCLFIGDVDPANYVANTDSISISIDNNLSTNPATCTPISPTFLEGRTSYSLTTSCYSVNPEIYRQRLYSGGKNNTRLKPATRDRHPIDKLKIASYISNAVRDNGASIMTAIEQSDYHLEFEIKKCVVKSMARSKGDGSKLQDQLSSSECQEIILTVYNDSPDLLTASNKRMTSNDTFETTPATRDITISTNSMKINVFKDTTDVMYTSTLKGLTKDAELIIDGAVCGTALTATDVTKIKTSDKITVTNSISAYGSYQVKAVVDKSTPAGTYYYYIFNPLTKGAGLMEIKVESASTS